MRDDSSTTATTVRYVYEMPSRMMTVLLIVVRMMMLMMMVNCDAYEGCRQFGDREDEDGDDDDYAG